MTTTTTNEAWHPRPKDIPDWRAALMREWSPSGSLTRVAPLLRAVSDGNQDFTPAWQHDTLEEASLWFVGGAMCDLLSSAAPQLPATELHHSLIPDLSGLVVFESPLEGIDADNLGAGPVHVGAMLWGPALWERDGSPILGVTVYGPHVARPWLLPLGGLIWPVGASCDDALNGEQWGEAVLPDYAVASMVEDRRRLLALWLLSTQPGVATTTTTRPARAVARRSARAGLDPAVRVIQLRDARPANVAESYDSARQYHHRWVTSGYWKMQHYGPGAQLRRPVYINAHLKGPKDAPLLDTPKVKAWTR
jgi:hypothetical protein